LKKCAEISDNFHLLIYEYDCAVKKDILPFLKKTGMAYSWTDIRTKVMNEQMAAKKRLQANMTRYTDKDD